MNIHAILKYLSSGIVVYALVAACGSESKKAGPQATAHPDSGLGTGGAAVGSLGGATSDAQAGLVGSVLDAMTNPVPDAEAQTDASTCSSCTVSGPIALAGTAKVISADSDPAQAVGGTTFGSAQLLSAGPVYVTDARLASYADSTGNVLYVANDASCAMQRYIAVFPSSSVVVQGARYFVPAGSFLCSNSTGGISWSGFHPYTL